MRDGLHSARSAPNLREEYLRGESMRLSLQFDVELDDDIVERLDATMRCDQSNREKLVSDYARAAFFEYTFMTAGDKVFTRFADLQEYRLFLLVEHYFHGLIPSDQEIASFFHIPYTTARSLARSMMSRYRNELGSVIHGSAREIIKKAEKVEDGSGVRRILAITSINMVDELNDAIAMSGSGQAPVAKIRNTMSNFSVPESSYKILCDQYGVEYTE